MMPIRELDGSTLTKSDFENKVSLFKEPVVLRSLVADWPIVEQAKRGVHQLVDYLTNLDNKNPCYTVVAPPSANGRLFYSDNLKGVNFKSVNAPLAPTLEQLLALSRVAEPHAVSVQAAVIKECLPGFRDDHPLDLLDSSIEPTLWISNRSRVAAHYDLNDNIACVASGRRLFTLFPPDQVANLYVGPTLNSPGGVPISMLDIKNPDFERFPNAREAMDNAFQVELDAGDAIYIPSPWWHSVESLESINVLINYWWNTHLRSDGPSANNTLMMAMLTLSSMDQKQRDSWKSFFDYFVFQSTGDPAAHLPCELNDLATGLNEDQRLKCLEFLAQECLKR